MKTTKEMIENLFSVAYDFMFSSSGDGCSLIVSDDYLKLAKYFEKWLKNNHPNHLGRSDRPQDNSTSFGFDQEFVVFTDSSGDIDRNMYEFIALLPSWYGDWIEDEEKGA